MWEKIQENTKDGALYPQRMGLVDKDERDDYLRGKGERIKNHEFVKGFLPSGSLGLIAKSKKRIFDNISFSIYKNRCFRNDGELVPKMEVRQILEEDLINNPENKERNSEHIKLLDSII